MAAREPAPTDVEFGVRRSGPILSRRWPSPWDDDTSRTDDDAPDIGGGGGGGGGTGDSDNPDCNPDDVGCEEVCDAESLADCEEVCSSDPLADIDETQCPPPDVSPDWWENASDTEKAYCWSHKIQCVIVANIAYNVSQWSKAQDLGGWVDGPEDAVRHCAWSGRMYAELQASTAEAWLEVHEAESLGSLSTEMDFFNNEIGRQLAHDEGLLWPEIGEYCLIYLEIGNLSVINGEDPGV